MRSLYRIAALSTVLLAPLSALAAVNNASLTYYKDFIVGTINGVLVPVLMALALLFFIWGVFKYYIKGADSDTERETGHKFILWSVIGFTVIVSMWGLVNIVTSVLLPNTTVNTHPDYPTL